jgi:hypothetical protein
VCLTRLQLATRSRPSAQRRAGGSYRCPPDAIPGTISGSHIVPVSCPVDNIAAAHGGCHNMYTAGKPEERQIDRLKV